MITTHMPLGLVAVLRPAAVPVLTALGMDLSLEGHRPFEEACAMRNKHVGEVLSLVDARERPELPEQDWGCVRASAGEWAPAAYLGV